jgi:hypothetical protein
MSASRQAASVLTSGTGSGASSTRTAQASQVAEASVLSSRAIGPSHQGQSTVNISNVTPLWLGGNLIEPEHRGSM